MRLFSPKSHPPGRSAGVGLTRYRGLAGTLVLATTLAACGGSSSPAPATSTADGAAASVAASGAPASAVPSTDASSSTAGNPSDSCLVVSKTDVEAAFGGSSTDGKAGEYGVCTFDVSGTLKAGDPGDSPLGLRVFFDTTYVPYATIKASAGDGVAMIDGLGTEAYYSAALGTLHVQVPGGMLTIGEKSQDLLDGAILQQSTIDLAKAILAHL